eukprot:CAMPEP_0184378074 /NCGR_PEP_ID=MMETSP0007-20130409/2776_1 /TAXON_ID=97485 /ORGANISM="Prymnesium parvum, Strain Texoma1" /LENGTH=190 /DNA_ID=CAMNT_0026722207 /DNA_START=60 /DNA_END=632 /DNA_ORIENTATION=-
MTTLLRVAITGKLSHSQLKNVTVGEEVSMSFLVDPKMITRMLEGHYVMDGIGPYAVCAEDFKLKFEGGAHMHLGAPPAPGPPDWTAPQLLFGLVKQRPVYDGAFVSYSPDGVTDVPLEVHGTYTDGAPAKYFGRFGLSTAAYTFPSLKITDSKGSYTPHGATHTFTVWRDWEANTVLAWEVTDVTIKNAI